MLLKKILAAMCAVMTLAMMSACDTPEKVDKTEDVMVTAQVTEESSTTAKSEMQIDDGISEEHTTEVDVTETEQNTEEEKSNTQFPASTDDTTSKEYTTDMYVGTYNDYDNNEPNLKISLNEDGTYGVVIGIFRLTSLEDGIGTLTEHGLEFTATDAAGNPIEGVITLEGDEAVVTFTNSTWELIENGTSYRYVKEKVM